VRPSYRDGSRPSTSISRADERGRNARTEYAILLGHGADATGSTPDDLRHPTRRAAADHLSAILAAQPGAVGAVLRREPRGEWRSLDGCRTAREELVRILGFDPQNTPGP
jgi:hypothetical protein